MKVRILSGNQTGAVVEMPQGEAEANIATGYAEAVVEGPPPAVVADMSVTFPEPRETQRARVRDEAKPAPKE